MFTSAEKPALEALGIRKNTLGMKPTKQLKYETTVEYEDNRKSPVDKIAKKIVVEVTDLEHKNKFTTFSEENYSSAEGDQMEKEALASRHYL